MAIDIRRAWPLVFGTALVAGCVSAVKTEPKGNSAQASVDRGLAAANAINGWPSISALAARRLIDQYGVPDEVRPYRLSWNGNRPWKRTVVRARAEDPDVVEQTVEYPLTPRQASDLASFDPRLSCDRKTRELSSRSDREEVNFLRLNLANDIVNRRMTPVQARGLYAQILRLEAAGKSSSYLQILHFPR